MVCALFSPVGWRLVTASGDKTGRLFRVVALSRIADCSGSTYAFLGSLCYRIICFSNLEWHPFAIRGSATCRRRWSRLSRTGETLPECLPKIRLAPLIRRASLSAESTFSRFCRPRLLWQELIAGGYLPQEGYRAHRVRTLDAHHMLEIPGTPALVRLTGPENGIWYRGPGASPRVSTSLMSLAPDA